MKLTSVRAPYRQFPSRLLVHSPAAVLDRLLHHAETVLIEGKSYRMKDRMDEP